MHNNQDNMRYQIDNIELEPSLEYPSDDCGEGTAIRNQEGEEGLFSGSDSSGASNRWRFKKKGKLNQINGNARKAAAHPLKLSMR